MRCGQLAWTRLALEILLFTYAEKSILKEDMENTHDKSLCVHQQGRKKLLKKKVLLLWGFQSCIRKAFHELHKML